MWKITKTCNYVLISLIKLYQLGITVNMSGGVISLCNGDTELFIELQ